jgi:hypothetical protein
MKMFLDLILFPIIRLAGRPEGYKFDTVTFYDGEHFMGTQINIFQGPKL